MIPFLVANNVSVLLLLSMIAICFRLLYHLDIKNVFLHSGLIEVVYMEQRLGFVVQGLVLCVGYAVAYMI